MLMMVQLWCHAITLIAESALEGIARVKSRCSAVGRNFMSSDLQVCITQYFYFVNLTHPFVPPCESVNLSHTQGVFS